jgi:hypothetical protein
MTLDRGSSRQMHYARQLAITSQSTFDFTNSENARESR